MLDNEHIQVSQVRAFDLNVVRIHCLVMVILGSDVLYSECKLSEDVAKDQFNEFKHEHQSDAQEFIAMMQEAAKSHPSSSEYLHPEELGSVKD